MMFRTSCIALLLLLASQAASACSILPSPPEEKFKRSEGVFLARTVSIERTPLPEAQGRWPHNHRQHVVWEVVKVWKGTATVGERFERSSTISGYMPCSGHYLVPDPSEAVFLSSSDEPAWPYVGMSTDYAIRMFNALTQGTAN